MILEMNLQKMSSKKHIYLNLIIWDESFSRVIIYFDEKCAVFWSQNSTLGKKVANKPRLRAYMLVNGETSKALNTVKEECFKISREMKTES